MSVVLNSPLQWLALAAVAFALLAVPAHSEEVTLRLKGGGLEVASELRAFNAGTFTINNPGIGEVNLEAERFECIAGACPEGTEAVVTLASAAVPQGPVEIRIAGSNTVGNQLMPELIKAFAGKSKLKAISVSQPDPLDLHFRLVNEAGDAVALVKLFRHGSSTSFRELLAGNVEIGMSSRPVKDEEVTEMAAAGLGDMRSSENEHILGLDGLLIIVAPNSPVTAMSIDDVARIFSGQITDWSELGYPPGPIKVYAPTPDSGTWDTFKSLVLDPRDLKLVETATRTENHAEQSDWVAADPLAIGHVGIAYRRSAKPLNMKTSCGLVVPPSRFAIKTEEYPLSRRLYLYTAGRPELPLAAELLDFSLSDDAQPAVAKADFIDQSPDTLSFEEHKARMVHAATVPGGDFDAALMAELTNELRKSERLSYTLRFNPDSTVLDNKSLQDVRRLSQTLIDEPYQTASVKLVGFSDAAGDFNANVTLSRARARAVQDAVVAASGGIIPPARLETFGFGELAPVACNDSTEGRAFNRRVEIWVEQPAVR